MTVDPDDVQPEVFSARDINLDDIEEDSLQGIVVLIGWLGCRKEHLQKYANWWHKQGWEPFLVLYPVFRLLSTSIAEHITGGRIKKLLHRLDELVAAGNSGRLVFHTFSNTGWISFGGILESFGSALLPHICGAVIDSAPQPAVSHTVLAAGSFSALFPRAKYNKYDVRVIVIKNFLKMVVQGEKKRRWKAVAKLLYCLSDFPQLYIFSTSDHVIPSDSIKAWIKGQESLGRRVSELQIDSSPHVQHMRHHKELYCQALSSFLGELQLPSKGKFNQDRLMQLQKNIPASLLATVRTSRSTGNLVTLEEDHCPVGLSKGMEEALAHVFPEESSESEDVSGSSKQSEEASLSAAYSLSMEAMDYRWETESVDTDCLSFEDARSDVSESFC